MLRVSSFVVPFCTGPGDVGALKLPKKLPNDSYQIIGLKSIMICWEVWTISFDKRGPPNLQLRIFSQTCYIFFCFWQWEGVLPPPPKNIGKHDSIGSKIFEDGFAKTFQKKPFSNQDIRFGSLLYSSLTHLMYMLSCYVNCGKSTAISQKTWINTIMLFQVQKSSFVDPKNSLLVP